MSELTRQDLRILAYYAENGNRELYWNYLARREGADGYGLLALGVVRNDSMPGAVANHFADNVARRSDVRMDERAWERFGEDLLTQDLALRTRHLNRGRADLALNLPVADVQRAHDASFNQFGINPNAWTPRQLLEAARRQGGDAAAERVWDNMLDGRGLGLGRMGITSWDVMYTYNDAQLPATRYMGALTIASGLAAGDRARTSPNVIGAQSVYYMYDEGSRRWASVSSGGGFGGTVIREVTDAQKLGELNDARAVRLESRAQREDWHPQDPNRTRPIARSPFTLADAGTLTPPDGRHASAAATAPDGFDHPLYRQALAAVARRDVELGREPDENTRRIALAGTVVALRNGYERIDDIVFSQQTDRLAAGDRFFVLQGERRDPAHLRESMSAREALAMDPQLAQREVAQLDVAQARVIAQEASRLEDTQRLQPGPQLA